MPNPGECIAGRYRLECPLGEGGMGSVWRARHVELDAPVAVKFQHLHRARSDGAAARFRKEARAAARLTSPNVVRVVDFGIDGDVPYIAMELLEGESLRARLERQVVSSLEEVLELTRQASSALDAAHAAGIVHRDFKPSNLFLVQSDEHEVVKLLDFGIAKWFEGEASLEGALTDDNLVVGSAHYMSPEQARGAAVDPRSDVWSLAVVAYQMLTGVVPFQGANIPDTLQRICSGRFEHPSRVLSPDYTSFDAVFARAFELDPDLRFETAGEFSNALTHAGQKLLGTTAPRACPTTSAGGWAFGRDGATLSVRLRPAPSSTRAPRRPFVMLALALALVTAVAVALPRLRSSASAVAPTKSDVSAADALPGRHVATAQGVTPIARQQGSAIPSARVTPPPPQPKAPGRRAASATVRAIAPARATATPAVAAAAPTMTASVELAPAPTPTARVEAPAHLDPVFGLEVPSRR